MGGSEVQGYPRYMGIWVFLWDLRLCLKQANKEQRANPKQKSKFWMTSLPLTRPYILKVLSLGISMSLRNKPSTYEHWKKHQNQTSINTVWNRSGKNFPGSPWERWRRGGERVLSVNLFIQSSFMTFWSQTQINTVLLSRDSPAGLL